MLTSLYPYGADFFIIVKKEVIHYMLYKPQNVYPHNTVIDADKANIFSFIFNGSNVKHKDTVFYYANSNNVYKRFYSDMDSSNWYNGDECLVRYDAGTFENGKSYKYSMRLFQKDYDIFVMEGTVRNIPELSLTPSQIPVSAELTNVHSPIYYNIEGEKTMVGACYIEIDDGNICERRLITNYNPNLKYGSDDGYGNYDYKSYFEIEAPFSVTPTPGTKYRVFCNYITSPEYFFQTKKTPVVSMPTIELTRLGKIHCKALYSQAQNTEIKYYEYELYKKTDGDSQPPIDTTVADYTGDENLSLQVNLNSIPINYHGEWLVGDSIYCTITHVEGDVTTQETRQVKTYSRKSGIVTVTDNFTQIPSVGDSVKIFAAVEKLINKSPKIYSQRLEYDLNDCMLDTECRVLCRVVTQDGVIVENSSTKTFTSVPLPDERPTICNCKINYKDCTVDISHGNYTEIIQREDMKTGEIKTLVSGTLLAQDWFAASNKTYRYHVVSIVEQDNEYKYTTERITNTVTPEWDCWSITALLLAEDESGFSECDGEIYRTDYTYGTWRLFVEPEMDDVVQNISPTVHETIHALPKVTSSEVNYISGGITCGLGQIECSDKTFIDDIYKVEAWRKFIAQKCVYLLKSPKGDVWVVNISSSPTSKYERNTKSLTTISFNFVETKALNEISIVT